MSAKDGVDYFVKWFLNMVIVILLGILSWNFARECDLNTKQDYRLNIVERDTAVMKSDVKRMAIDVDEIKRDVKTLLRRDQ
jgi:hypothetical protein